MLAFAGHLGEAYTVSAELVGSGLQSIDALTFHFHIALDVGRFAESHATLQRLEPFIPRKDVFDLYRVVYWLEAGIPGQVGSLLPKLHVALTQPEDVRLHRILLMVELGYHLISAHNPKDYPELQTRMEGETHILIQLYYFRWLMRTGAVTSARFHSLLSELQSPVQLQLYAGLLDTEILAVDGKYALALQRCEQQKLEFVQSGWGSLLAEFYQLYCDMLLVNQRFAVLETVTTEFLEFAQRLPSSRYEAEARFYSTLLPTRAIDWGELVRLACLTDLAPRAARRARTLLGDTPELDLLDRAVLLALGTQSSLGVAQVLSPADTGISSLDGASTFPGLGLVEDEFSVIFEDGMRICLSRRQQLWSILTALYQRGGAATKEQLVKDVWKEKRYSPQLHDHRLHVGVRKLRGIIEADPSKPSRLITTHTGYALTGRVWRITRD
jgi:hypothetical protein